MICSEILQDISYEVKKGSVNIEIHDLVYDSRKVMPCSLFFCMIGTRFDSHECIADVAAKGASAIVIERDIKVDANICVIRVENSRSALSKAAAAFFGYPLKRLKSIGITGTKGKTTTAYMLKTLLEESGYQTGIIGTLGAFYGNTSRETHNTTPESYEIQKILSEMVKEGVTHLVMEVSSQAYLMHRVDGMKFDYGIFTNISPDHIGEGEHASFEDYLSCKSKLFQNCEVGVVNADDEHKDEILKDHICEVVTFGMKDGVDLKGDSVRCYKEPGFIGIDFLVSGLYEMELRVGCMGKFNAYNAMAAMAVAAKLEISKDVVQRVMYYMAVRGRVEPVLISERFHLIIDYAHNAVSAKSLLATMREYHPKRLVTVFGAGGNRSRMRRFDMGEISGKYADLSIITSDNPRFEKPEAIIENIVTGIKKTDGKYITITNRREAIRYSIEHAKEGDLIVLFGKGHEDYQEIEGVRYPFDERVVIANIVEELKKEEKMV